MLNFFDYVYYRVCKAYSTTSDSNPRITALLVVALLQFFHLFTVFVIIEVLIHKKSHGGKGIVVIVMLALFLVNGLRYNRLNYDVLKEKWDRELEKRKKINGAMVLFYIVASTILCFGLAIYFGGKKW